jgi:hypothetical protein
MVDSPEIEEKPWWQSRAIIGTAVSSVAIVVGMAGVEMDVGVTTELVVGLVAIVGNAFAWWGRVQATQPISKRKILPGIGG